MSHRFQMCWKKKLGNFYLFGSGFTKAVFEDAPLNADLVSTIINIDGVDSPLGRLRDKYQLDDIEILLTRLDLDILCSADATDRASTRIAVENQLAAFFGRYRFRQEILVSKPWLRKFSLDLLTENDTILTVNYDCFLDGLLDFLEIWTPNGGYLHIHNPLVEETPCNPRGIVILKIHGSENFRLSSVFRHPEQETVSYDFNPSIFPKSAARSFFRGGIDSRPYVIAPSYVKIPKVEIAYLMMAALTRVNESMNSVISGCSFRNEDSFLWLLLTNFLRQSEKWRNKRILVIDPAADNLCDKIRNYWPASIFNESNLVSIPTGIELGIDKTCNTLNS